MNAAAVFENLIPMRATILTCWILLVAAPSGAQPLVGFLAGAGTALAMHEAGHVVTDIAFGAAPGIKRVSFAGIPFFAITHPSVTPGREFVISSAGFWVQEAWSDVMLSRSPRLHAEGSTFVKGMLAFNVLTSAGYAAAAFARVGPDERDTRGMAVAARLDEPWIGGIVLVPAVLDAARYYKPQLRWLRWASRASKLAGVVLAVRAAD